jgi:hypothetical protein
MSLEHFKQPEVSCEEITTPELVQERKAAYEQAEADLRLANEKCLKKADQIKNEEMRKLVMARLGLVSVRLAEINREVMVGLN